MAQYANQSQLDAYKNNPMPEQTMSPQQAGTTKPQVGKVGPDTIWTPKPTPAPVDPGFAGPTRPAAPVQKHTAGGVLGGAHMGGHSDVASKLGVTQLPNTKKSKK